MKLRSVGWLLVAAAAAVALFIFWRGRADFEWDPSPQQVIYQEDEIGGGPMAPSTCWYRYPGLTVFGDGKVIFTKWDPSRHGKYLYQAQLPQAKLQPLLSRANRTLTGLDPHYDSHTTVDGGETAFSLVTVGGIRTVRIGALDGRKYWLVRRKIRGLSDAFQNVLLARAEPYVPDRIAVIVTPTTYNVDAANVQDWPASLPLPPAAPETPPTERLEPVIIQGAAAQELAQLPLVPAPLVRAGGRVYVINIVPDFQLLYTWC